MSRLKLLNYVSNDLYPTVRLENVLLIGCQHVLGTTYEMFEELFRKGLKPENSFLIGKCYSTHRGTYKKFKQRGVRISPLSQAFDSHASFDEQFLTYIETFLSDIQKNIRIEQYERVIILDDGGHLLLFINDFLKDFNNVIGIEQTSSGYQRLLDIELHYPVINVARSEGKLEIESPMIASLVTAKIEYSLIGSSYVNPRMLIVGRGSLGQKIAELLQEKWVVNVCDVLEDRCDFSGNYKGHLSDFEIIIGATGNTVICPGEFSILKQGVTLISASSSDREFSAAYLRALLPKEDNCHKDITVNEITLLNSGFPINFDGAEHSLPREQVQFTRALLLSAVYECSLMRTIQMRGFIELNRETQENIIKMFTQIK